MPSRAVPRPFLESLYIMAVIMVGKRRQLRQQELNVESIYHTDGAYFRLFCTALG